MLQASAAVQLVILLKAPPEVKAIVVAAAGPARPKAKALASIIVRIIDKSSEWFEFVLMRGPCHSAFQWISSLFIAKSL
jgi:hypothetical protein